MLRLNGKLIADKQIIVQRVVKVNEPDFIANSISVFCVLDIYAVGKHPVEYLIILGQVLTGQVENLAEGLFFGIMGQRRVERIDGRLYPPAQHNLGQVLPFFFLFFGHEVGVPLLLEQVYYVFFQV
jgi:hypothetical protein